MADDGAGIMEEEIPGMMDGKKINLMIMLVSMPVGGVENLVLSVARNIDKQKYNVSICCIKELGSLGRLAKDMGINIIELNLMKSNRFNPSMVIPISRMFKKHKVHVLWTHQYVANLYGRMAAFLAGTPVVVPAFHVLYIKPKFHRRVFNHLLAKKTDIMISVSNAVSSDMIRYDRVDPRKIKVIHNGIDLMKFNSPVSRQDARKTFNLPPGSTIIGTVSRMTEQKGHRYFILATDK